MKILLAIPFLESLDGPRKLYGELRKKGVHTGEYCYEYRGHIINVLFRRNTTICNARNEFGREAVKHRYDYLFFNDADIQGSLDDLIKLCESGKDIIGGGYEEHKTNQLQVWDLKAGKAAKKYKYGDKFGLIPADGIATGFVAVNVKNVLEKMEYPWFHRSKYLGDVPTDDFWFCNDAKKAEIGIFWDADIRLKHFKRDIATIKTYIDNLLTSTEGQKMTEKTTEQRVKEKFDINVNANKQIEELQAAYGKQQKIYESQLLQLHTTVSNAWQQLTGIIEDRGWDNAKIKEVLGKDIKLVNSRE